MSPRYFLQSPSPRHCWPRSVWPRFRVFPPRPAQWPKIQLVNYLLTPLQLILIHTRVCSGNTITPQATPCRSSPPHRVRAVVAFARYHLLEPAPRHLSSGKAEPRVDFASSDTW